MAESAHVTNVPAGPLTREEWNAWVKHARATAQPVRVRTMAEAQALPEGGPFGAVPLRKEDGRIVSARIMVSILAWSGEEDVLAFIDADGRPMQVIQTVFGPRKWARG